MNLFLVLFLIGILGFVLNRKNIILMLISIEIMLLAITLLILINSFTFDDILSQGFITIFTSSLFFISILIYMFVSFFLHIGLALLCLYDFKFSISIFIRFILTVIYVLWFYVLSISTFVVLTASVLSSLCFSDSRTPKLNTGIKLLTSSTGSIIYIGAGCLVYYVVIGMILNLTIAVSALTPTETLTDITNGLTGVSTFLTTKSSAFPTSQDFSSIINTPMTCAPSQYLIHDIIV
jgi:NADH-ubiquinone oxidoreductase chain 4L